MGTMQDWWQATFPGGRRSLTITDASGYPVQIAYGEKGTGQPLFLVHGVASWSYSWRYNIDALSQHFRVICFDAKGCGFSDKPLHEEGVGHQAIELKRIIRSLCNQPAIVVAESLGALTSLGMVQAHPDLVSHLVLINVPIFPERLPSWGMRLLAEIPLEVVRLADQLRLMQGIAPFVRQVVHLARHEVVVDPAQVTMEEVYWVTYPQIEFPNTITKLAEDLQLAALEIDLLQQGQRNLISDIQSRLSKITCPTLILWADQDRWYPVEDGKRLHDRLPNSQFQIIPNCGHYAAGSQPEFINSAIIRFVAS